MANSTALEITGWMSWPLCSKYVSVHIAALRMQVREGGSTRDLNLHWSLGALADGQHEVLDVWIEAEQATDWHRVFDDLKARGVEAIRYVVADAVIAVAEVFPGMAILPPVATALVKNPHIASESTRAVSVRHRRVLTSADEFVQQTHAQVNRAAVRHGHFDCPEDALVFAANALKRAKGRFDLAHASIERLSKHCALSCKPARASRTASL